jgi:hypothetical protein
MIKITFLTLVSLCSFGALSTEWQHENPNFDRTGQVTIKSLAGVTSQLVNTGQQGLQSSASPTVLNISMGGKKVPHFAVLSGSKVWAFFDGAGFVEYTQGEFNTVFNYTSDLNKITSGVVASLTVSGEASPGMSNRCSAVQMVGSHPQGYSLVSSSQSPCSMTFKVGELHYDSSHRIWCDGYMCSTNSRGDIMFDGRSIATSVGNTFYSGSSEDLYGTELSQEFYHAIGYTYFDRIPEFYSATTSVRANPYTQSIFVVKHNGDTYWRAAQTGSINALYYDISEASPPPLDFRGLQPGLALA